MSEEANGTIRDLTRRRLVTGGLAAALGALVAAIAPRRADAADGDALRIGEANTGSTATSLTAAAGAGGAFQVTNPSDPAGDGPGDTALGATGFIALRAVSRGTKTFNGPGEGPVGVQGTYVARAATPTAFGVGVDGSVNSDQVDPQGLGWPLASDRGVGVKGQSGQDAAPWSPGSEPTVLRGTGVAGVGSVNGVLAASKSGRALNVHGKAHFSRSGMATIAAGTRSEVVTGVPMSAGSMIFVTVQGSPGANVYVTHAVRRNADSFVVWLNRKAHKHVRFAWMVLD